MLVPSNQAPVFRLAILIDLGLQLLQYPASRRCFGVSALPSPFFAIELHYPRGPHPTQYGILGRMAVTFSCL